MEVTCSFKGLKRNIWKLAVAIQPDALSKLFDEFQPFMNKLLC